MTARRLVAAVIVVVIGLAAAAGSGAVGAAAAAAAGRPSYTQELNVFMCVECHESLAVAQSPESFSERQYLRTLIAQGNTAAQIKQQMVANYGPGVLAVPPASGFNLVIYILPAVLLALAVGGLAYTVPLWRRRTAASAAAAASPGVTGLAADDARRLDEDLSRYA